MREFSRSRWKILGCMVAFGCVAVVASAYPPPGGGVEEQAPCFEGCNTGQCWLVDGECWKAPQTTCCDVSWATDPGGTRTSDGPNIIATRKTQCNGECAEVNITDERAACGQTDTDPEATWSIWHCHCAI